MTETRKVIFGEENNVEQERTEHESKWEEFNLKPGLVKGCYSLGFDRPSYIQKRAVPSIVKGENIRAQAHSGTGKTGAFCVGALEKIDETLDATQVLVLVSTREIARQIASVFTGLSKYMKVNTMLLTGGCPRAEDVETLNSKPHHVIVGTPGRVHDMFESGVINSAHIKLLILDEADELCKGEFLDQIKKIYDFLDSTTLQVLFFSATYSAEEIKTIGYIVQNPIEIDLTNEEYSLQGIKQFYINLGNSHDSKFGGGYSIEKKKMELALKVGTLIEVLKTQPLGQMMIFIRRKADAQAVYNMLDAVDFPVSLISSNLTQQERNDVIAEFKGGKKRFLVTSDILKRGIDVQGLSVVVCLDVPPYEAKEDFIHRVGRSGRYGRRGVALHIVNEQEFVVLKQIAEDFKTTLSPLNKSFDLTQ